MKNDSKVFKESERAAQERNRIPKEKAGFDHIPRERSWDKWDKGYDRIFGKKK